MLSVELLLVLTIVFFDTKSNLTVEEECSPTVQKVASFAFIIVVLVCLDVECTQVMYEVKQAVQHLSLLRTSPYFRSDAAMCNLL